MIGEVAQHGQCLLNAVKRYLQVLVVAAGQDVAADARVGQRLQSATAARRAQLLVLITAIFEVSDQTYGYCWVHAQLARQGSGCGPELVRDLMRNAGLVACQPRAWRGGLTEADGHEHDIPDLLEQDFTADAPGTTLIGDITSIPTWQGWLYLATVIDVHTRMVIGYSNYTSAEHATTLRELGLRRSMGRTGVCWDCEQPAVAAAATPWPSPSSPP